MSADEVRIAVVVGQAVSDEVQMLLEEVQVSANEVHMSFDEVVEAQYRTHSPAYEAQKAIDMVPASRHEV